METGLSKVREKQDRSASIKRNFYEERVVTLKHKNRSIDENLLSYRSKENEEKNEVLRLHD